MLKVKAKNGTEYTFYRTRNDINGNPRYIVGWLDLGLKKYQASELTKKAGLALYRGKDFGGGFVFQSYSVEADANYFEELGLTN